MNAIPVSCPDADTAAAAAAAAVGAVRRGRKFAQVVEGALKIFLRDGFEGASVDDIAREAGVSKATLYSYFPDKRVLFTEVFSLECSREAASTEPAVQLPLDDARAILDQGAQRIIAFMMSDFARGITRLLTAEVSRFPEIARDFHDKGPRKLRGGLVERLEELVAAGQLDIPDMELAADQFVQLCRALSHERLMLDLHEDITPEELDRARNGAVEMFLARYGTLRV